MTDPAAMEGMMGMMKGNMAMMIPQTLIMSWINAFFAGFVISQSSCFSLFAAYPNLADEGFSEISGARLTKVYQTYSEASISFDHPIQIDATSRSCNARLGCSMGFELIMVLSQSVRAAADIYLPFGERQ